MSAQRFEAAQVEVVQFIGVIGSDRRWPFARVESGCDGAHRFTVTGVTPHELRPDLYPNPTDGLPKQEP
ncbi:hypothetical protein [Enterobacter ludwigii]|uniref:hypothetical protein n=1 Tax=Enterobacter ludwigii TaxID=299767 RepID=UPI003BF9E687